jgi:hypothetical protein
VSSDVVAARKWAPQISQLVGWASATLLLAAALLPWESVPIGISFNGLATDGVLAMIRGLIFAALVFGFPRRWAAVCAMLLGILILAVSVGDTAAVPEPIKVGFGLVLTDLAAVGCIVAGVLAITERRTPQWVGWGSATLLVVAVFLPWESVLTGPSFSGLELDGITTLIGGLIFAALVSGFPRRWAAICGGLLGVLILAVSVWDTEAISGPFEEIGVGLVLTDVAAVGCILASVIAASQRRTPARVLPQGGNSTKAGTPTDLARQ